MGREIVHVGKTPESEIVKAEQSVVESSANNQPIQIWGCGAIFTAHLPIEISNQNAIVLPNQSQVEDRASFLLPVIRSHRRGTMSGDEKEELGRIVKEVHRRRIVREAIKAFGETFEEQKANFELEFLKNNESYVYLSQALKAKGIRLGPLALRRLAGEFEKVKQKRKVGRPPLQINEDEIVRLCLEENKIGEEIAGIMHCSSSKVSQILRSKEIYRRFGRRPRPAKPL